MKPSRFVILLLVVCAAIAVALIYLNRQKALPVPASVAEAPEPIKEAPSQRNVPQQELTATITPDASTSAPAAIVASAPSDIKTNDAADSIHKAVDALLSAKSAAQKHELFQQLLKAGQLDQVMAELKQRATDHPDDAEIPTTLGEAQLNKVAAIHAAGGDVNDMGILAMQADQSFNAALKIDPKNWEAQFVKSSAMFYWPPDTARDNDVVQRLSSLIDQQETMTSQPEFAQTYVVLGNEYQKLGQTDKAEATWQLGLTKFPGNSALQNKINGQ